MTIKFIYTPSNEGYIDCLEQVEFKIDNEIWDLKLFEKRLQQFLDLTGHKFKVKLKYKKGKEDVSEDHY